MPLSSYPVRTSVAVSGIDQAVAFYEGKLGLSVVRSGPSAAIEGGSLGYASGGAPALNVYESATAGKTDATLVTWYVRWRPSPSTPWCRRRTRGCCTDMDPVGSFVNGFRASNSGLIR